MKFGSREICNVVFKAKSAVQIGTATFAKGQPVLYIDTAKTSTLEGAATTVYAQGGRGNTRLVAWEGEKTLTFTVEDALLSPIGFSILAGAGLFESTSETVHLHKTATAYCDTTGAIDLTSEFIETEGIDTTAPIFVVEAEADGSLTGTVVPVTAVTSTVSSTTVCRALKADAATYGGKNVFVDFYMTKSSAGISELQIDADNFAGYYYVEAETLFRRQDDGKDLPAVLTFPNVKVQSNFTFNMSSTGDPSTFTFTMDAFPGYTIFDSTKKVLLVMQVVDESISKNNALDTVMPHNSKNSESDEIRATGSITSGTNETKTTT